jgi:protein-S-isoprenylcysteine O-methyltransferase Ste14
MTSALAYLLIGVYFILERSLRQGEAALNLKASNMDEGSSRLLWGSSIVGLLGMLLAPILNTYGMFSVEWLAIAWVGIGLMVAGLCLRYWAAQEIGTFYTRTLQVLPEHRVIDTGPYRLIRHPGYLGTSLLAWGAGLALQNGLILLVVIVTDVVAKYYRIRVEENMLSKFLEDKYREYIDRTFKLIPFIY